MKYRLAIFDLDGTILDTLDDLADSTNAVLESNSLPVRTRDEIRRFVGNGIHLLIERAVPEGSSEELIEKVFADFKTYYKAHCSEKTAPYAGIPELITKLRSSGCRVAVVSNKADFAVQELCMQYFPGIIDFAVGEREGVRRKPAPDSSFESMSMLGMKPSDSIYIGDSDVDIETARNAGIPCLSVTWGFRDRDFLLAHNAERLVSSPDEIAEIILG